MATVLVDMPLSDLVASERTWSCHFQVRTCLKIPYLCVCVCVCVCWVFITVHTLSLVVAIGATFHCNAWASHCSGFSCCGAWALGAQTSVVVSHGLSCCEAYGIFLAKYRTCVSCTSRQILIHQITREVPRFYSFAVSPCRLPCPPLTM